MVLAVNDRRVYCFFQRKCHARCAGGKIAANNTADVEEEMLQAVIVSFKTVLKAGKLNLSPIFSSS